MTGAIARGRVSRCNPGQDLSTIWAACAERAVQQALGGEFRRIVESQEQVATNRLVSSLEEQALLESLLESSKPPVPGGCEKLHIC